VSLLAQLRARDYDEAVRLAKRFLTSQPNDPWEHTILGWTYEQKRMLEQAIVEFQSAIAATKGDSFFLAPLGHAYALAGRRTDAEQVLHTLLARAKKSYVFSLRHSADLHGSRRKGFGIRLA